MRVRLTPEQREQCWEIIRSEAPASISWSHYDLAVETPINDIEIWKTFLLDPEVQEWVSEERALLHEYELAKLTQDVSRSRSMGQAQLINSMEKLSAQNRNKAATGPIFVYTYIPLNEAQKAAPNVAMLQEDVFLDKPTYEAPILFNAEQEPTADIPDFTALSD